MGLNKEQIESLNGSKATGFSTMPSDDLQGEINSIKDSYASKKLPSDLKLNPNRAGIKANNKEATNILTNCAKYGETCLKILAAIQRKSMNPQYCANDQLQELFVVLVAMMRYVQEDCCSLIVAGSFREKAQGIFRSIRHHTSAFTPDCLEDLKSVATAGSHTRTSESIKKLFWMW